MRILLLLLVLTACSGLTNLDYNNGRLAEYDSYLREHVQKKRIFLRLSETANAKVLIATPRLAELQALVVPSFELPLVPGTTRMVISLEMPDWSRFNIADFKFLLDGNPAKSVKEIMDGQLLQTLYPFAVPHDRAFTVEFAGNSGSDLRIQTSQGEFKFTLGAQ